METPSSGSSQSSPAAATAGALVYVMSPDPQTATSKGEIDLVRLWNILWRSRWLIVIITLAFALGSFVYTLLAQRMYTASVVLSPVKEEPLGALTGQLGGLASLAGLGSRSSGSVEAVAVLKSRDFARSFIEDQALLPVLFPDAWDASAGRWKVARPPEPAQAARYFVARVRQVDEDSKTGLVTLSIEWRDPELAAGWANMLAVRLNDRMRQRALAEAEANVKYLRHEFESTSIVTLQQSISGLLEKEMQKLMLARGNAEFSFRVIDRAEVPTAASKPRRTLILVLATAFGAMLAVFVVLIQDVIRSRSSSSPGELSPRRPFGKV
jgi:uncharacterized protein involved in exopolysaccharide biosynthesis